MELFTGSPEVERASAPQPIESPAPRAAPSSPTKVIESSPAPQLPAPSAAGSESEPAETRMATDTPSPAAPVTEQAETVEPPAAEEPLKPEDGPRIAIIIDDVGLSEAGAAEATALPPPLTLAFLPYAHGLETMTADAYAAGHEIFLHMPMEPTSEDADPGPDALLGNLSAAELDRRIADDLRRVPGAVGVNNHMGSRLTAERPAMIRVMTAMKANGLVFVDSRTTAATVAETVAEEMGVPHTRRDVFLDNERKPERIREQLTKLEEKALSAGTAIGIGHPYPETLAVLAEWLPNAKKRGVIFVRASTLAGLDKPAAVARHGE